MSKNAKLNTKQPMNKNAPHHMSKNVKRNTKLFARKQLLPKAMEPLLLQLMVLPQPFQVMVTKLVKDMVLHKPLQKDMAPQLLQNVNNKKNKSAKTYLSKLKSKNADKSHNKNANKYQNKSPSKFLSKNASKLSVNN